MINQSMNHFHRHIISMCTLAGDVTYTSDITISVTASDIYISISAPNICMNISASNILLNIRASNIA